MVMFRYSIILGLLSGIVGLVVGNTVSNIEVAYKCAPTPSSVCFVNALTLEDAKANLMLHGAADKRTLNIKGDKVEALLPQHCQSLSQFEKVLIGRVGLKELCFATSFVQVSAEHNRIKTLHVEQTAAYRLEELRLNDNQLESVDAICHFVALKELHLERNSLSTLDMKCFSAMTHLKKLHLANNRLNLITTTIGALHLPALSFIGLQNNTLTELDLHKWSLPSVEVLELFSNNLTNVRGLEKLEMLSDISLAGNRWYCDELDQMLAALDNNGVSVTDGDHDCTGIRNATICCKYEQLSSEGTLLAELKNIAELEKRYDEAESVLRESVRQEIEQFESKIKELKATHAKRNEVPVVGIETATEQPTDPPVSGSSSNPDSAVQCDCICSKDSIDNLMLKLTELESSISANNATLQVLRDNQSQVSYMALLAKHEFRTAVKRGEYKLKELSSMLSMLREHIRQKQQKQ